MQLRPTEKEDLSRRTSPLATRDVRSVASLLNSVHEEQSRVNLVEVANLVKVAVHQPPVAPNVVDS